MASIVALLVGRASCSTSLRELMGPPVDCCLGNHAGKAFVNEFVDVLKCMNAQVDISDT